MATNKVSKKDLEELGAPAGTEVPKEETISVQAPPVTSRDRQAKKNVTIGAIQPVKVHRDAAAAEDLPPSENELVEILVDEELHINGQRLFGRVRVPRHQARSIIPMIQAKKRTDIEVHTGRNFQVQKTLNRGIVVTEIDEE